MESVATSTRCTGLFYSANQLCIYGAVTKWCGTNSEEASQSYSKVLANYLKQEHLKSLVDFPRLPHASGNRMLQSLKDFNAMP